VARVPLANKCKPWFNSDHLVDVEWFYVPEGTPCYPGLHSFGCPAWDKNFFWNPPGAGEVGMTLQPGKYGNPNLPPLWLEPREFCGDPQKMIDGYDFETDPPEVELFGWPVCCLQGRTFGQGGIALGGHAPYGGARFVHAVVVGGSAQWPMHFHDRGGVKVGGSAQWPMHPANRGGIKVGGSAF
jgi:hypothetical protein